MEERADELTLEMDRVLPAPSPVVFAAFTDPEELADWWGPEGFSIPGLEFRPRVGDGYRIEMQPPEGDSFSLTGEFREVDPPRRLAYTFVWEPPDPDDVETLAELSFRDLGEATAVALRQGSFKTEARLEVHRGGWTDSLDKLERLVAVSSQGTEVVRRVVEAFNQRDLAAMTRLFAPEVEWEPGGPAAVERDVYRGRDEVAGGFAATWETWELFHLEESELRDLGESILWLGRARLTGHVELDQEFAVRFLVRGGKVLRFRGFQSWRDALDAAGLDE